MKGTDGIGVIGLPSVGEAPGGGPGLAPGLGVQDEALIAAWSARPTLLGTFLIMCAQQR